MTQGLSSCTKEEDLKQYKGHDLPAMHCIPPMSHHPLARDWCPVTNKPTAVLHWLNHI
ncbi:hypothetical protein HanRHA438_Chr06g0261581 [Helianthus annuus]|nr:hypothetical protein HanRHA438_Chr06g0261581 [Helianthus annuus]